MNIIKKSIYLIVGTISFILGIIGIFLPLLPTTPLLLLTSYCLLKSSDKLNGKFMQTAIYKKYVKEFIEKGGMTLKAKLMLTIPVSLLLLFMFITIHNYIMRMIIVIMWITKLIVFTKMKTIKVEARNV
ncbi:MAG: YbaN family protein [Terrisporobacter sp.]|uniref:YbaN family protein n=1 Tax=Terrisporobacter sp. TaxID=1965305 RepID=UPI002FCC23D1